VQQQVEQADVAESSLMELIGACLETEGQYREVHAKSEKQMMIRALEVEKEELRAETELFERHITMLNEQFTERSISQQAALAEAVVNSDFPARMGLLRQTPTPLSREMKRNTAPERCISQQAAFAPSLAGLDAAVNSDFTARMGFLRQTLNPSSREVERNTAPPSPQRSLSGTCRPQRSLSGTRRLHMSAAPLAVSHNSNIRTSSAYFLSNSPDLIRQLLNSAATL